MVHRPRREHGPLPVQARPDERRAPAHAVEQERARRVVRRGEHVGHVEAVRVELGGVALEEDGVGAEGGLEGERGGRLLPVVAVVRAVRGEG